MIAVGPWIWGKTADLLAFGGSAMLALTVVLVGHWTGASDAKLPDWSYLAFILGIDVAHVYATLFRTYFDREEVARRRRLYLALPVACWVAGVLLHLASPLFFWRTLAYLAVFHFVRQQRGWVAIYRARARENLAIDRILDDATIYAAAGVPLLVWHATLPRKFVWFVSGDFVSVDALAPLLPAIEGAYVVLLALFAARQAWIAVTAQRVNAGKSLVVTTTALAWWVGICGTNSDLDFTATNVIIHGVPYLFLLWHYARARHEEAPGLVGSKVVALGVGGFFGAVVALAIVEEMIWDRLVWHDRPWLFGGAGTLSLAAWAQAIVVPLLAVPQATHYAIDAFLWRRKDVTPAQTRALGFGAAPLLR